MTVCLHTISAWYDPWLPKVHSKQKIIYLKPVFEFCQHIFIVLFSTIPIADVAYEQRTVAMNIVHFLIIRIFQI